MENRPTGQIAQLSTPVLIEKLPGGQLRHPEAPCSG